MVKGAILDRFSISSAHFGVENSGELQRLGHSKATARQWRHMWVVSFIQASLGSMTEREQNRNILERISGGNRPDGESALRRDWRSRMDTCSLCISWSISCRVASVWMAAVIVAIPKKTVHVSVPHEFGSSARTCRQSRDGTRELI